MLISIKIFDVNIVRYIILCHGFTKPRKRFSRKSNKVAMAFCSYCFLLADWSVSPIFFISITTNDEQNLINVYFANSFIEEHG